MSRCSSGYLRLKMLVKAITLAYSKTMKMIIAVMLLASAVSLRAQGQLSESSSQMVEASHQLAWNGEAVSPLFPPTPFEDMASEAPSIFQPSLSLSPSIQSVPEPSTFAFGSLTFGMFALVQSYKRRHLKPDNRWHDLRR